jgi:hypothetical protein
MSQLQALSATVPPVRLEIRKQLIALGRAPGLVESDEVGEVLGAFALEPTRLGEANGHPGGQVAFTLDDQLR